VRDGIRFVAASQPGSGLFINAVPKYQHYAVPSWAMSIAVATRLGLPLVASAPTLGQLSRRGLRFDALGDVARSDGEAGHVTRHQGLLEAIYYMVQGVVGKQAAKMENGKVAHLTGHRPDLTIRSNRLRCFDLKLFDPIGSHPAEAATRGSYLAFGNTIERADDLVLGRAERNPGAGEFNRRTGVGHVAGKSGDYASCEKHGIEAVPLLCETFGGFGPGLIALIDELGEIRRNRLTHDEYDQATWATRSWKSFVKQRLSVALHMAVAGEIAEAMGMAAGVDERAR
jgi:hypothetical protein